MKNCCLLITFLLTIMVSIFTVFADTIHDDKLTSLRVVTDSLQIEIKYLSTTLDSLKKSGERESESEMIARLAFSGGILFFILILVIILLFLTKKSHEKMLDRINEEGESTEITTFLMKQSLGLPQGSLRGIIALVVTTTFVSAVFFYGNVKDVPDSFKIIVSLVFGYYFSKREDQTKSVIDAMLGKTKQQALKRQEANAALAEAKAEGAEEYATQLYNDAKSLLLKAENIQSAKDSIDSYRKAIETAREAKMEAITKKDMDIEEKNNTNREKYDSIETEIIRRIGDLREVKIDSRGVEKLVETAKDQARKKNFDGALRTIERVKERVDGLLAEYDEAEEIFKKINEKDRDKIEDELEDARKVFNNSFVNNLPGNNDEIIESIIKIQGAVKERDPSLVPVLKKRFLGVDFTSDDLKDLVKDVQNRGDKSIFKSLLDSAANKVGVKLTDKIRDEIDAPEFIEKIFLGDEKEKNSIFGSLFTKNGVDKKVFFKRIQEGLVDYILGDTMRKNVAEGVDFETIVSVIQGGQEDKDGKGVISKVEKILSVGETILSFTPLSGIAKVAGNVIRGIFKIFGKNKRNRRD